MEASHNGGSQSTRSFRVDWLGLVGVFAHAGESASSLLRVAARSAKTCGVTPVFACLTCPISGRFIPSIPPSRTPPETSLPGFWGVIGSRPACRSPPVRRRLWPSGRGSSYGREQPADAIGIDADGRVSSAPTFSAQRVISADAERRPDASTNAPAAALQRSSCAPGR